MTDIRAAELAVWESRLGDQAYGDIRWMVAEEQVKVTKLGHLGVGAVVFLNDTGGQGLAPTGAPLTLPRGDYQRSRFTAREAQEIMMQDCNEG